ncbi:beta-lactamase family protein [bacterium]|nr:beta-lactamase family protein [bacterium]
MTARNTFTCSFLVILLLTAALPAFTQDGPPKFVRDAVRRVETLLDSEGDGAIAAFIDSAMAPAKDRTREDLIVHIRTVREALRGLRDDIAVEVDEEGVRLMLAGGGKEKQLRITLDVAAEAITGLTVLEGPEPIILTTDNLVETFDQFERAGGAGVVSIRFDGTLLLERAFGMADPDRGVPNRLNTVFGTGSRPIDYTVAAIQLLDQQGVISIEDPISDYFENVPADKRTMTVRHLMSGQSGLPDFFHTENDRDPDLAWIDRSTAVQRLLAAQLLFAPGTDRRHSHAAFGLLAALVELITDQSYYGFLREHFFDPAGMERTGEYGESRGLTLDDFAVGGGPQRVGLPNIPPNWGPTSWLIKGSGGMYSTLGDLQAFYRLIRSGSVLDDAHSSMFRRPMVGLDGSDRGFELFSASIPPDTEICLFLNAAGSRERARQLIRALERFAGPEQ